MNSESLSGPRDRSVGVYWPLVCLLCRMREDGFSGSKGRRWEVVA